MRTLYSGSGSIAGPHYGPKLVKRGYPTIAYGHADKIVLPEGEVAVKMQPGNTSNFSRWVIGPVDEVIEYLEGLRKARGAESADWK